MYVLPVWNSLLLIIIHKIQQRKAVCLKHPFQNGGSYMCTLCLDSSEHSKSSKCNEMTKFSLTCGMGTENCNSYRCFICGLYVSYISHACINCPICAQWAPYMLHITALYVSYMWNSHIPKFIPVICVLYQGYRWRSPLPQLAVIL